MAVLNSLGCHGWLNCMCSQKKGRQVGYPIVAESYVMDGRLPEFNMWALMAELYVLLKECVGGWLNPMCF